MPVRGSGSQISGEENSPALDEFREIVFDFRDIDFMGQGFADEVFRVFQNQHPDITMTVINANESVLGMIRHVKR